MTAWAELWEFVVERDAEFLWRSSSDRSYAHWRSLNPVICMARALDPSNPYRCGGKQEVDHVKDQLRMGKRATDDAEHLVAACQNHNTWYPPRKELRAAQRAYLARFRVAVATP
jgi:hypothetical protein